MVIGADFSERMSQKPEPTPCRDFKDPQLGKRFEVSDVIVVKIFMVKGSEIAGVLHL